MTVIFQQIAFPDLARRNFLSGHNSAKVTYLCKFCRHRCIQGCKYSCRSQWYCCRASLRDKRVVKRCIHQGLEKVEMSKLHGKCLKQKYFRDSPKRTKRMRNKKMTKKTRKKRTKRKKKTKRRKMKNWRKKTNRTRKKKTNRARKKRRKKTWKKWTKRPRKKDTVDPRRRTRKTTTRT